MTQPLRLCLAVVSLAWVACTPEPEPVSYEEPTVAPPSADPLELEGSWAYKHVVSQYVGELFGDGKDPQTVLAFGIVGLEHEPDSLELTWQRLKLCYSQGSEVSGTVSEVAPGYLAAVPQLRAPVTLSAAAFGAAFVLDTQVEIFGAELDTVEDELPTTTDDPRVFDFDSDGNPGYTVTIDGPIDGSIWSVQRNTWRLDGVLYSADLIAGGILADYEDSFLWTSSNLIPRDPGVEPDLDPTHSYFEMVRLSADMSCTQLLESAETLFPSGDSARR